MQMKSSEEEDRGDDHDGDYAIIYTKMAIIWID